MEFKELKRENSLVTIEYRMSFDEFTPFLDKVYKRERGKFTIPGFRKGRAPRKLIELNYGEGIFYDDALNEMIPDMYDKSIEELDLHPVAQPAFSMEELDKETGIVLHAEVALYPEVKLGEYKNLKVEKVDTEVTDEDITKEIEKEAEKNARLVPVEVSEDGDIVDIDFDGSVDGVAFDGGQAEHFELELGSGSFIPGFEDQLIGVKAGEEKDVTVTFPEEYHAEELAGKEAVFKVKVHDIKRKELPEIDDEFIGDISEFETLEEYKKDLREKMEESKKEFAEGQKKEDALKQAIENMEVDLPEPMVEEGISRKLQETDYSLQQQGFSLKQYMEMLGMQEEAMREQFRGQVEIDIKREMLLEAIVKEEDFEVAQEDIDAFIQKSLEDMPSMEEDRLREIYGAPEYESLKHSIKMDKALDLIFDTMEVK